MLPIPECGNRPQIDRCGSHVTIPFRSSVNSRPVVADPLCTPATTGRGFTNIGSLVILATGKNAARLCPRKENRRSCLWARPPGKI